MSADALYEQAGFTRRSADDPEEAPPVAKAIAEDPRLSARQRQALLEVYYSFIGRRARRR